MMPTVGRRKLFNVIKDRCVLGSFITSCSATRALKFSYHIPKSNRTNAFHGCEVWSSLNRAKMWHSEVLPHMHPLDVRCFLSLERSSIDVQNNSSVKDMVHSRHSLFPACASPMSIRRYSSHASKSQDHLEPPSSTATGDSPIQNSDAGVSDWIDAVNRVYQSVVDAAIYGGKMLKDASDEAGPYIKQLFDSNPYLKDIIIPVGWTLSATVLAWVVLPRLLRRFHYYSSQTPIALLSLKTPQGPVPYERSLWCALEDPARYLVTFIAFSQLGVMIAPTTSQYLLQAWRGALVLSVVWFLQRWKSNVVSLSLSNQITIGLERDKLLALDKISSVGFIILGVMALAEACGVAVQSVLTVGGIGGVATAFAARDILGNFLSGLSLQFSQPFSIGDNIKAGSIEGQVVEMGLTTTSLINSEKLPVLVPNSLFSSQVIINKTRAQLRAFVKTIPFCIDDLEKIPNLSEMIRNMLRSHPAIVLEREAPYCFLSRIEDSYAELTIGCNLKNMRKEEWYSAEQDILLQASRIIKEHGAELGSTLNRFPSR